MAVRRIYRGRGSDGEIALTTLWGSVKRHCSDLTVEWYRTEVAAKPDRDADLVDRWVTDFKAKWCEGGNSLSRSVVEADQTAMGQQLRVVRDWADRTIAHISEAEPPATMTWGELKASIEAIGAMLQRYEALFSGSHWVLLPAIEGDWREPFRRALFDSLPSP